MILLYIIYHIHIISNIYIIIYIFYYYCCYYNNLRKIEINKNEKDESLNVKLRNMEISSLSSNIIIYTNCVFIIRNTKDFSCYKGKK